MIDRAVDAFLFSPREAERERAATALTHRRPRQKPNPRKTERVLGDRYTVDSYRRAIERGCKAADVAVWRPVPVSPENRAPHSGWPYPPMQVRMQDAKLSADCHVTAHPVLSGNRSTQVRNSDCPRAPILKPRSGRSFLTTCRGLSPQRRTRPTVLRRSTQSEPQTTVVSWSFNGWSVGSA